MGATYRVIFSCIVFPMASNVVRFKVLKPDALRVDWDAPYKVVFDNNFYGLLNLVLIDVATWAALGLAARAVALPKSMVAWKCVDSLIMLVAVFALVGEKDTACEGVLCAIVENKPEGDMPAALIGGSAIVVGYVAAAKFFGIGAKFVLAGAPAVLFVAILVGGAIMWSRADARLGRTISERRSNRVTVGHVGINFNPQQCQIFDSIAWDLSGTTRTRTATIVKLVFLNTTKEVKARMMSGLYIYTSKVATCQHVTVKPLQYRWGYWGGEQNKELFFTDRPFSFEKKEGPLGVLLTACQYDHPLYVENALADFFDRYAVDGAGCGIGFIVNPLPSDVPALKNFAVEVEIEIRHEGFREDSRLGRDWCDCGFGRGDGGQLEIHDGHRWQKFRVDGEYHEFVCEAPNPSGRIWWRCWTAPHANAPHGQADKRNDNHATWNVVRKMRLYDKGESLFDRTFGFTVRAVRKDVAACHSNSGRIFWEFEVA